MNDLLKLKNQLCFPLYACSKEVVKRYKPFLDPLGLTYTQYIAMMVLWEHGDATVKELGRQLYLDSGTLTPLLKKMEAQGLVTRERCAEDERSVVIRLTPRGTELQEAAASVPLQMGRCMSLDTKDMRTLYDLLYKTLSHLSAQDGGADS